LAKSYEVNGSRVNALNGVNLTIHQSQIFGLLGRNGAGKTTLVDILTGVTQPSQGSFRLASPSVGICYQHEVLYEELTVDQHLAFYARIKPFVLPAGETLEEHIQETIRTLGIEGERGKRVKELSGGNKRKLSIAIAILGRPGLLIFDEPTSGLDPLSRINVW
jgi:ABC-type multidrug transport system ATPase subunit